ncbi:MAG: hypothetical protein WCR63_05025 [Bacilli bacterium]
MMNKREKKNLYLGSIELAQFLLLSVMIFVTLARGIDIYVYTFVIGVVPFILMVLQFYPTMDLFKRKGNMNKIEWIELFGFFINIALYITCLFLLNNYLV